MPGSLMKAATVAAVATAVASASPSRGGLVRGVPVPSAAQLEYQQREIVALTHFNMATFFREGDPACSAFNWAKSQKPAAFAPTKLNISNWLESYRAVGAKSAILTAKHGCGFHLWPTNVTLPNGDNYGYHVGGEGGIGIDIVGEFARVMQEAKMPHGFYYSLKDSFYMNAINDAVRPPSTLIHGQVNVTQQQFEDIEVAAVTELWSNYGDLAEIWFDGGVAASVAKQVVPLLHKLQPNAAAFGAGIENSPNDLDWVGTESGLPNYPIWSTGCEGSGAGGSGTPPGTAVDYCPKVGDCTLQAPDVWFYVPGTPIKSLATLQDMYHHTVGQNNVMELDFAVDREGLIDPAHAARYKEFGDWIRTCYGSPVATSGESFTELEVGKALDVSVPAGTVVDRVAVMEDISKGEVITQYTVSAKYAGGVEDYVPFVSGTAVGHKHINIAAFKAANITSLRLVVNASVATPFVRLSAFAPC